MGMTKAFITPTPVANSTEVVTKLLSHLESCLAPKGLTIVYPLQLDWYACSYMLRSNRSIAPFPQRLSVRMDIIIAFTMLELR
jgi:hypothetical protein